MAFDIKVKKRQKTENNDKMRKKGDIPGVVYGPDIDSQSVTVNRKDFEDLYEEAGSSLINFMIDGEKDPIIVLIQDLQFDPVTRDLIHADFRQIPMDQELTTEIDVNFIGEPPAVKEQGGILIKGLEGLSIKCLPKDLVQYIDVDLSILKTFDDTILVSDVDFPEGIKPLDNADTLIAKVSEPLSEEEIAAMEESALGSVEDVEVEGEEGEEAEEGEAVEGEEGEEKPETDQEEKKEQGE